MQLELSTIAGSFWIFVGQVIVNECSFVLAVQMFVAGYVKKKQESVLPSYQAAIARAIQ
jgi:predicted  nucleic acid-binding Zn ribbon protein